MFRNIFLLFFVVHALGLFAQVPDFKNGYTPLACDSNVFVDYVAQTDQRYVADVASLKQQPKAYRLELGEMYKKRYNGIKYKYEDSHFYSDSVLNNYFQNVFKHILQANPAVPQDVRLLVARYPWANAACYGEGTVIVNLDLLCWLENESQLAFVLCHELAHYYADHVNQDMLNYVASIKDPEMQKKLRQIYYGQYNTYEQALALIKDFTYSDRKHSRLHESNADSLAIIFLRNTDYSETEALGALRQLDKVDAETYDTLNWPISKLFSAYTFKNEWLQEEGGLSSFGKANRKDIGELDADSMKTHPDCEQRIELLSKLVKDVPGKKAFLVSESYYRQLQEMAKFERINNIYYFGNLGRTLFLSIYMLREYPNNTFLMGKAAITLLQLYEAQKNHEMGKYLALAGASDIYSYNELLKIMNNLRLDEMGKVGSRFAQQYHDYYKDNEDLHYALMQFYKLEDKQELYISLKKKYEAAYPEGNYISRL